MTTKEKAHPLCHQGMGQCGAESDRADRIPSTDYSTNLKKPQGIFDLLPEGESNAVNSKKLAELTGATSVRELQNRIAVEREEGKLILSTCRNGGGYFRPSHGADGRKEICDFVATLRARALSTLKVLRAAKNALGVMDGQVDFDDLEALMSEDSVE